MFNSTEIGEGVRLIAVAEAEAAWREVSEVFGPRSPPNDTSPGMHHRPVPEQNLAE